MTVEAILLGQLADPFRWGLLLALVATMLRTEGETGRWLPLAVGETFVAAIIPVGIGAPTAVPLRQAIALGLVANVVILAVLLLAWEGWRRLR